jgi:phosphate transport system substrate-binding protein
VKNLALVIAVAATLPSCGPQGKLIQNKGSDTMLEVAQKWAEHYHDHVKPNVGVSVSGGGSGVGITALIDGTTDIANCSRAMKEKEIEDAKKKGHTPVQHHVGYDGIAIFVHKENPIASITLEQLKQIYIDGGTITKWSQLGVTIPEVSDDTIHVVSRQSNSGTYVYFREAVLGEKANFRLGTSDMNGSKDVVDHVSKVRTAIGYSGLAYATEHVRMVPVTKGEGSKAVAPSIDSVLDHSYPISRPLFMYTSGDPQGDVKDYLDWIKSDAGQLILQQQGYPPLRKITSPPAQPR